MQIYAFPASAATAAGLAYVSAPSARTLHLTYSCGDAKTFKDKLQATSHAESADQTNDTKWRMRLSIGTVCMATVAPNTYVLFPTIVSFR